MIRKSWADLARRVLPAVGVRAVTRTIQGQPLRVPVAVGALRPLLFDPGYVAFYCEEAVMDALLSRVRPGDIVFDIGAYHGFHAVLLARASRRVVAFEPNPVAFPVLRETLAVNDARNVAARQLALGAAAGRAELRGTGSAASLRPDARPGRAASLRPDARPGRAASLRPDAGPGRAASPPPGGRRTSGRAVDVETLDRFVAAFGASPDVMKIDVEGAEGDLLRGGRRALAACRVICLELHLDRLPEFGATAAGVERALAAAGFEEVFRRTPTRDGAADRSRCHLVLERAYC